MGDKKIDASCKMDLYAKMQEAVECKYWLVHNGYGPHRVDVYRVDEGENGYKFEVKTYFRVIEGK